MLQTGLYARPGPARQAGPTVSQVGPFCRKGPFTRSSPNNYLITISGISCARKEVPSLPPIKGVAMT